MRSLRYHGSNLMGLLNKAKKVLFDNTGSGLSSTNVEDAIKELDEYSKVDIKQQDLSNFTITGGQTGYCFVAKRGKLCELSLDGTPTNTTSMQKICTLPSDYGAKLNVRTTITQYGVTTGNVNFFAIADNEVYFYSNTSTRYMIHITYIGK